MFTYEPSPFVESVGYQPVEFLDLPRMSEAGRREPLPSSGGARLSESQRWRLTWAVRRYIGDLVELYEGDDTDVGLVIDELAESEADQSRR